MSYNVGFDFDGVIHTNVTPHDKYGQRHPSIPFNKIPSQPFYKILKLIKLYYLHNCNIYIITARSSQSKDIIYNTLKNFGIDKYISENNIITTGDTYNGDKIDVLEYLKIIDFYDDSIKIFNSIKNAKNINKLYKLKNCYMTFPEKNKIIKLDF
jgi:acid phosphatase class B